MNLSSRFGRGAGHRSTLLLVEAIVASRQSGDPGRRRCLNITAVVAHTVISVFLPPRPCLCLSISRYGRSSRDAKPGW